MITIDFETRSKVSIKSAGAWRYAADPSTKVLCLGFSVNDGPVDIWTPGEAFPFSSKSFHQELFEAHHAFFEKAIWRNIMVPQYGWPDIPDRQWTCTASRAAAQALPRTLDMVCKALNLPVQKDAWGKSTMLKLARPCTPSKANPTGWHEGREDYEKLYEYCRTDVAAEVGLSKALRPLNPTEREVWLLDQKINERGIRVDRRAVDCAIKILQENEEKLYKEFRQLTGGMVHTVGQRDKFLLWLSTLGVSSEKLAKADVLNLLEDPSLKPVARKALVIRQALSKTSTAKYQAIQKALCDDDRLRDLLMYHGASTGRWTGKLVQPQNFPRQVLKKGLETCFEILKTGDLDRFELAYEDVTGTLSGIIRGVFIPSEGHLFFGGDYAAIEARVLFWLAGESKGLQMFRDGEDLYKDMAANIYGVPVAQVTKAQREMGKRAILGCGYGMGVKKFKDTCQLFARVEVSEELADKAVTAYRDKYRTVPIMWRSQEYAAKEAVMQKGKPVKCGRITWMTKGKFLYAALPSGRLLSFYDPKIEVHETSWGEKKDTVTYMSVNSVSKQWERTKTYGGKITENLCQAVARDLMAEAMLRCEKAGYKICLSVHDELLCERVGGSVDEFENLMSELPAWAKGCPVKSEGWSGSRYSK